jgi:TPR repeat protein
MFADVGGARLEAGYALLVGAAELGEPRAQHVLAGAYQTGILPGVRSTLVPLDHGRSLLLEHLSALAGLPEANMGMGWRYQYGRGVMESCDKALLHYEYAANHVVAVLKTRPYMMYVHKERLTGTAEGPSGGRRAGADMEVVDYYKHMALRDRDPAAAMSLANLYLNGNADIEQNVGSAMEYLTLAADLGHVAASGQLSYLMLQGLSTNNTGSRISTSMEVVSPRTGLHALGSLAEDFWESYESRRQGPASPQQAQAGEDGSGNGIDWRHHYSEALRLGRYAHQRGDVTGTLALGLAMYKGLATPVNSTRAAAYFGAAAAKVTELSIPSFGSKYPVRIADRRLLI